MKENEALKLMESLQISHDCEMVKTLDFKATVIKALEDLQQYRAIGTVEELKKSVKEEDVLKFYYIESEDKYVVGRRVDTKYYAEVGKTGLAFYMSRYLPWGEHVVDTTSAWKEHTYPSEPKEIPFFEWLQGFIKKECGGTIDECRTAVERMKPKKPFQPFGTHSYKCSNCWKFVAHEVDDNCDLSSLAEWCPYCGSRIDWSE